MNVYLNLCTTCLLVNHVPSKRYYYFLEGSSSSFVIKLKKKVQGKYISSFLVLFSDQAFAPLEINNICKNVIKANSRTGLIV